MLFIKEIYLHVNKHIFVMFWEKSHRFLSTFKKKWKPQSIYRTAICTENQIWKKVFFRKDPSPTAPDVHFKTQI